MSIAEDASVEVSHDTGCWLRFNDVVVDEFAMNQVSLESECFGGSYKAKTSDGRCYVVSGFDWNAFLTTPLVQGSHPDMRVRFWNAYMLFYEARDHATKTRGVALADSTPIPASPHLPDDKLSHSTALRLGSIILTRARFIRGARARNYYVTQIQIIKRDC